jgi:hypothetical protein
MEITTTMSNLAYDLDNCIDLREINNILFELNVLERAIKNYKKNSKKYLNKEDNKPKSL